MAVAPPLTYLLIASGGGIPAPAVATQAAWWTMSEWQRLLPAVVSLWLLGVLFFSLRLFGAWRFTARLQSTAHPAPAEWRQAMERIAQRVGSSRPVRLLVSSIVDVPTVIGWLRPVILIPLESLVGLPVDHITALLAHELAHIRQNDYLASILQSIAEAVLFYHPAVWWISEQVRAERELCCDDLAVAASGDALTYARALAELESRQSSRLRPGVAANGGSLVNRIRRLIEPAHASVNNVPGPAAAWAMTLLWLAGVGVTVVHAAQTPAPRVVNLNPVAGPARAGAAPTAGPVAAMASHARDTLLYDPLLSAQVADSVVPPQGRGGGPGELGPVPVSVSRVRRADMPVYLNGLGNVTPSNTVTVKSRVDGQILSVNFQEGDLVKQDQVLFTIDPQPYEIRLTEAEGQLERDHAQLTGAQKDLKRLQALYNSGVIGADQLNAEVALAGQMGGTLKADQAAVENAKLRLAYATVTAPIAGRIGLRLVDPGNIVHAADNTGLLVISKLQPIAVLFQVPEDSLQPVVKKLRGGAKLTVEAWNRSYSAKIATGYLLAVDNAIDETSGAAKLKAVFSNSDEELFPGQFVNTRMLLETQGDQIVIPIAAIENSSQGSFVYVVGDNSRVQVRPVTTGVFSNADIQILSGLEIGEQVVVKGTDRLQNKAEVRIER
jgi:multidrug efflux system membrane fusion protein